MTLDQISDGLKQFIQKSFDSIEAIEIVLLLRNAPGKFLSAEELNAILRSNIQSIGERLKTLVVKGIVQTRVESEKTLYAYLADDLQKTKHMDELAENYIVRRFAIINLIYSGKLQELHKFADVFDLRGKKGK